MAYYGNLALQPERKPEHIRNPAKQPEKVIRRRPVPIGEKLLYMLTVAFVRDRGRLYHLSLCQNLSNQSSNLGDQSRLRSIDESDPKHCNGKRKVERSEAKLLRKPEKWVTSQLDPERSITIGEADAPCLKLGN